MRKSLLKFCLLVCIALFSVACSNTEKLAENEFIIEGKLYDIDDGVVIMLLRTNDNNRMNGANFIATDTVKNGRFSFKGEAVSNPDWLSIVSLSEGFYPMPLDVWITPGAKVKITGKGKMFQLWKVKSSVSYQKEANLYTNKSSDIIAEMVHNGIERDALMAKRNAAASEEESRAYRKSMDSIGVIGTSLTGKLYLAYADVMEQLNISDVWLDKMQLIVRSLSDLDSGFEQAENLRKKANELYGKMSAKDKNTPTGQLITVSLFPPAVVGVGDDMADTDLLDINGNTKRLSDYLGKYLLLDFWSRGCGPCIMALPEMKEILETYSDNLTIISVSLDTDNWWKEAMTKYDMPWINIRDPKSFGGLAANYGVTGIPNYVMISPEGKVVDKWMGFGTGYLKRKVGENIK